MSLLVRGLTVRYSGDVQAVTGISFTLAGGETVALVGESGSGKSTVLRAILGMLPRGTRLSGSVRLDGQELLGRPDRELRAVRGRRIGYVAQDPYGSCAPLWTVGHHVREAWRVHGLSPDQESILDRLRALGLSGADHWLRRRPAAWSGGMLQRADIVAATAHQPPVLLADEPTSALDADVAETALAELVTQSRSLLVTSHDLGLACRHADRVLVLRGGRVVDDVRVARAGLAALADLATHEHTRELVAAVPTGRRRLPAARYGQVVARLTGVSLGYPPEPPVVSDVDLAVAAGEAIGIHGPSGSGKSTVLRALAGLLRPASGHLLLGDVEVWAGRRPRLPRPGYVMPVFQDAGGSLDPRWTIGRSVAEALSGPRDRVERVRELLGQVGLSGVDPQRRPGELSGGQRQRVALARALAGSPALIVADEPTAQLDPTIAAGVTKAMRAAVDSGCALVMVSHDVARLRGLCDRTFRLAEATLHPDP